MKNILILAAGKQDISSTVFSGYESYGLYPIRGKPSILWTINTINFDIEDNVIFLIDSNNFDLENLLKNHHITRQCKILKIDTKLSKNGILDTLKLGLSKCDKNSKTQILLGDTLILDNQNDTFDAVFTSNNFHDSYRWCLIEKDKNSFIKKYFDKVKNLDSENKEVIVGLYNIFDTSLFEESLIKTINKSKKEISDVLQYYQKQRPLLAFNVKKWYDLSSPYAIAIAGSSFFNVRHFNQIVISEFGILTKSSENKQKLKQEEQWYKSLPQALQIFTPRVIDSKEDDKNFYLSIEMYGYQTLSEIFVYGGRRVEDWYSIIQKLIKAYSLFGKFKSDFSREFLVSIYKDKTCQRLEMLRNDIFFSNLLSQDIIFINGVEYKNYNLIKEEIFLMIDKIIDGCDKKFSIIHGDFCLSNILFDSMNYCFKFIDPRGDVIYGDPRYDIAKLRHSIVGLYDFITLDMFELNQISDINFNLKIFIDEVKTKIGSYFDGIIEKRYNLFEIKFIESLLFLTMIPLHKDFRSKQLAFYLIAIRKFNELFYGK